MIDLPEGGTVLGFDGNDDAEWGGVAGSGGADDGALHLALEGWEGPLDLLLELARKQKVDLREISILALVDQYLEFLDGAEQLKLEVAADYLVMAAWLAYLKSSLLLPGPAPAPAPAAAGRHAGGCGAPHGARPCGA